MNSPLQLRRIAFTKVHVDVLSSTPITSNIRTTITTGLNVAIDDKNPRHVIIRMRVKFVPEEGEQPFYSGEIEAVANFDVDESIPLERAYKLAVVNGASILYGAIREMVTSITARGPLNMPIVLGSMSFTQSAEDLMTEIAKRQKRVHPEESKPA